MTGTTNPRAGDRSTRFSAIRSAMADRRVVLALKLAVSVGTLAIVAGAMSIGDLVAYVAGVEWIWLGAALVVFELAQLVSALRCVYVARALGGALTWGRSLRAHFVGLWFNQVLPTGLGGDVVKVALLRRDLGLGLAVRATALDRVSGLVLLMVSVAVLLFAYQRLLDNTALTMVLAALSLGSLSALILLAAFAKTIGAGLGSAPWLGHIVGLLDSLNRFRSGRPLFEQFWTSSVVHVNGIVSYALIGRALGLELDIFVYFLLVPLVFLIALFPISLAGWGVREIGALSLFSLVGVPAEQSVALSALFGVLLIVAALPGLALILSRSTGAAEDRPASATAPSGD